MVNQFPPDSVAFYQIRQIDSNQFTCQDVNRSAIQRIGQGLRRRGWDVLAYQYPLEYPAWIESFDLSFTFAGKACFAQWSFGFQELATLLVDKLVIAEGR